MAAGGTGGHNATSSAIALAVSVMTGSEPEAGRQDLVSDFLDRIGPADITGDRS